MHLNTVFAAVAAFIATGANAAAFQSRQKPNPPQIELATYGNGNCANQHFNGFSMQYVVPADDIGKCRTFMQDKDYHVGSIGVMFTESYQNDTCAFQTYADAECKESVKYHIIGQCAQKLIA